MKSKPAPTPSQMLTKARDDYEQCIIAASQLRRDYEEKNRAILADASAKWSRISTLISITAKE